MRALSHIGHPSRPYALALAAIVGVLAAAPARAATLTWGTSGTGGDGTWTTGSGGWWNGSSANWTAGDSAIFQGTAGTVTLGGAVTSGSVVFSVDGYTITGNTLTLNSGFVANNSATVNSNVALGANQSWSVGTGKTLTLGGVVSGASTLTYGGSGTYAINGVNTNSGNLTIDTATVTVSSTATLFGSGLGWAGRTVTLQNGGTLIATNFANGAGNLWGQVGDGAGTVTYGTGGGTFTLNTSTDMGAVNKGFTVNSGVTGTFSIPTGVSGTWSGSYGGRDFTVNSTGTLTFAIGGSFTTSRYISGSGGVTKTGGGTLQLTSVNSFSGPVTVTSGTLDAAVGTSSGNASAIGNGNTVNIGSGGTLLFSGGSRTAGYHQGAVNINGGTLTFNTLDNSLAVSNTVTLGTSAGTISGTGQWRFRGGATMQVLAAADGSTVSVNDLNLYDNTETFNIASGATLTVSSSMTGGGTLTKSGAGTLKLTGTNSYSGNTNVNAGTLVATGTGALSGYASSGKVVFGGGMLQIPVDGTAWTMAQVDTLDANATKTSGTLALDIASGTQTQSTGTFAGSIGLAKIGAGTLVLSQSNSYTGTTSIAAGVLGLNNANALGGGGNITFAGGTLQFSASNTVDYATRFKSSGSAIALDTNGQSVTMSGAIDNTNTGGLTKAGAGTLTLSAANTYTGTTSIAAGVLGLGHASALGGGGNITFAGGTLQFSASNTADYATRFKNSGSAIALDTNGQSVTMSGAIDSTNTGGLTKAGAGTLTLSAANTYTGTTSIAAGVLGLGNASALGGGGNITFVGGTLQFSASNTVDYATQFKSSGSAVALDTNGQSFTMSGTIDNTNTGGLTKAGAGTLTLSAANTYTGTTSIAAGVLGLGNANALGGGGNITFAGGTLQFSASNTVDYATRFKSSGSAIALDTNGQSFTMSGVIDNTNTGGLTKAGAGTLTLSAANTYTGTTTVSTGTLQVGDGGTTGSLASAVIVNNANLVYSFSTTGAVTLASGSTTGTGNLTVTARDINLGGAVALGTTGTIAITQVGAGTFPYCIALGGGARTISGSSITLAGDVGNKNADGGSLALDTSAANGPMSINISLGRSGVTYIPTSFTANSGTGTISIVGSGPNSSGWRTTPVTLTGRMSITAAVNSGATVTLNEATATGTVSAAFSGGMSLVKGGAGTLSLSASSSYSGGTTLNTGQLNLNNASAIGSGAFTIASGTIDNTSGGSITLSTNNTQSWNGDFAFAGSNPLNLGTGAVTLGASRQVTVTSSTLTVGGAIGGSGYGLTKSGNGTLVLSASSSYSGGTTLNAGQLNLNNASAIGTGNFTIAGGTIDNTSGGSITLSTNNAQSWNGDFTFAGSNPLNLGTGAVTLSANRQVTVTSSTLTVGGGVGGAFALTKAGAGTLVLSASNSYSGGTTLNAGTLSLGNARALGAQTGDLVVNGGTLDLGGLGVTVGSFSGTGGTITGTTNSALTVTQASSGTYSGTIAGSTALTKAGAGTLKLTAVNSFTGAIVINAGTLEAAAATAGGSASSIGNGSNAITIGSGATLLFTGNRGAGYSNGAVTVNGGTLTFSGSDASLAVGSTVTLGTSASTINGGGQWRFRGNATMRVLPEANGSTVSVATLDLYDGTENFNVDSGATLSVSSKITSEGGGNLLKSGSGTMVLSSGSSSYYGTTTVRAGTLVAGANAPSGAAGAFGNSSGAILVGDGSTGATDAPAVLIGGAFTVGRDILVGSSTNANAWTPVLGGTNTSGTATFSGSVTLSATASAYTGLLLRAAPGGTVDFTGAWTTNNKPITVGSAGNTGTVRLSSALATTGTVTVSAGTLLVGSASALGSTTPVILSAATTLDLAGYAASIGTLAGSGTITGTTGGVLTVTQAANATYAGSLAGSVGLTKAGSAKLTLSGVSTNSGATTVNSGTLALPSGASIGSSAVTVANAAALTGSGTAGATTVLNGGLLAPGDSGTGVLTLAALTFGTAGGNTATVSIPTNLLTSIPATLQVNGDVVTNGGTGSVTFAFGSLALVPTGTYGLITYTGALASGTSPFTYTGSLSGRQGVNFDNSGGALSLVISNAFPIWSGTAGTGWWATDNWSLNTTGSATTFLDTDTVYFTDAGTAGTVSISGSNVVPSTTTFSSATNAYTVTSPDGFGIAGTGSLLKSGAATVTIANTNSFSGGSTISAGTLVVTGSGGLGSGGVTVSGGLLSFTGTGSLGSGAVTLTSGTIQMGSAAALGSGTVTVNGGLLSSTGSGSLGSGPLTLNAGTVQAGSDTALASGTLTLNGGALSSNSGTARSLANPIAIGGSVTLGDATNNGNLTLSGAVNLGGATRSLTTPSNVTLSGSVSNGSLTKAGAGRLSLTGAASLSGATTITGGTLQIGGGAVINSGSYASGINVSSGAALSIATSANQSLAGVISGSGSLAKSGAGLLTLASGNTYTGKTTIAGGTVSIAADSGLGAAPGAAVADQLSFDGGALRITAGSQTLAANRGITLAAGGGTVDTSSLASSQTMTIAGVIAGTGPLTLNSTGNQSSSGGGDGGRGIYLSATNTFSGTITVTTGFLSYASDAALGNAANQVVLTGGGLLDANVSIALAHPIVVSAGTSTFRVYNGGSPTWSGAISGAATVNRTDGGTLTLAGDLSGFTGTFDNQSGATVLSGSAAGLGAGAQIKVSASTVTFASGRLGSGTAVMNGGTLRWANGNTDGSANIGLVSGVTATLDTNGNDVNLLTGFGAGTSGNVTKTGAGSLTLSGSYGFTGTLTVSSGTLGLAGTLSGMSLLSINTATLSVSGGTTSVPFLKASDSSGAVSVVNQTGGTLTITGSNNSNTTSASLLLGHWAGSTTWNMSGGTLNSTGAMMSLGWDGTATVNQSGGTANLLGINLANSKSNAATYNLTGGRLNIGSSGITANTAKTVNLGSGTVGALANWSSSQNMALTSTATGVTFDPSGYTITLSGTLSGSGRLNVLGSGTLVLSAANTYTGATAIQSGMLKLGLNNAIPGSSAITLGSASSTATLDLDTHALAISSLTFDGLGGTLPDSGGSVTLQNVATGTARITVLSGTANEFHPNVTLSSTTVIDVSSGASLLLHATLSGSSPLTKNGVGLLQIFGNNENYLGAISLTGGTTQLLGGNATLGSGTTTVFTGATLDFNNRAFVGTYVLAGGTAINISSGSTTVQITGTSTISGTSTAADFLVTSTGSAAFDLALTSTSAVTIDLGGRATFNQSVAGLVDAHGTSTFNGSVLAGANIQVGGTSQSGALATFAGDLAHSSNVTVLGGALATFTGTAAGSIATSGTVDLTGRVTSTGGITVNSGGIARILDGAVYDAADLENAGSIVVNRTTDLALGAAIDGVGSLTKQGASTLTLTGTSGYSGGTTISAGTVALSGAGSVGTGAVSLAASTALDISGADGNRTIGALTGVAGSAIALGSNTLTAGDASNTTFAGAISGAGGFTKAGAGALTLSASNSYAGATTISGGTLALSGAGNIASSSGVNISGSGAKLDISGASGNRTMLSLEAVAGSAVLLGANTLTADNATNKTFAGVISGSGGFTKAGAGVLTLTDAQAFTGTARVDAGTLAIAGTNTLATANKIYVAAGGTLGATAAGISVVSGQTLGGYGTVTGNATFLAGSYLSPGGSVGTLYESGTATWNGGTHYTFEVNQANGTPGIDPGWDLYNITGDLNLSVTGTDKIFIDLTSLSGTSAGSAANFNQNYDYAWKFVVAGSDIGSFNSSFFTVTTTSFSNGTNGTFYVARGDSVAGGTSKELYVMYAAAPEPGTLALAGIGLAVAGWTAHRRRRRRAA